MSAPRRTMERYNTGRYVCVRAKAAVRRLCEQRRGGAAGNRDGATNMGDGRQLERTLDKRGLSINRISYAARQNHCELK